MLDLYTQIARIKIQNNNSKIAECYSIFALIFASMSNTSISNHHFCDSSTIRHRLQRFVICLEDESWIGTPIRRSLIMTYLLKGSGQTLNKNESASEDSSEKRTFGLEFRTKPLFRSPYLLFFFLFCRYHQCAETSRRCHVIWIDRKRTKVVVLVYPLCKLPQEFSASVFVTAFTRFRTKSSFFKGSKSRSPS